MAVSLYISIAQNSQNIANNTSNVTVKVVASWTYGSYNHNLKTGSLTIDGTKYSFSNNFNTSETQSGSKTLFTKTVNVNHNADGSKTLSCSASYVTGVSSGTIGASASKELTKIPRAATIDSAPNFDDEDNPTITYSNPAGNAVTTLEACISLDGTKDDIAYRAISKTGSSYTFNLTDAERKVLRQAANSANSISVRFYVATTIGDTTYRKYLTKTLSIVNATPTINPTITDTNNVTASLTGDSNTLIRYFSNAAITFGASALKGASIKSRKVECGSKSLTADGTMSAVDAGKFVFTVTDSRGNTTTKTVTKSIVNYVKLTCGLANTEFNTDGVISFNIKGNYFNGSFGTTANTLSVQYRYKLADGSYSSWADVTATKSGNTYNAAVTISGLDYRLKYVIQARAVDKLATVNSSDKTMSCIPVFDWSGEDFNFNVPVNMGENVYFDNGGTGIRGTTTTGADVQAFAPCNANDNCVIGYGAYTEGLGGTNLYGNEVRIISNDSVYVNGMEIAENNVLWSGEYYMTDSQTIKLSEGVSKQANGIVLVFSRYNSGAVNESFSSHFVPKELVRLHSGNGHNFNLCGAWANGVKYLYIRDTEITGHANNKGERTVGGITYNNSYYVLRYVIGV